MAYRTYTEEQDVTAVDVATMGEMTTEEYSEYLRTGLLTVDHHDILRSEPAGYPIAVTKAQFKVLLSYLKEIEHQVGSI